MYPEWRSWRWHHPTSAGPGREVHCRRREGRGRACPSSQAEPAKSPTTTSKIGMAFQPCAYKRWSSAIKCFTSLCPFCSLEMIYSLHDKQRRCSHIASVSRMTMQSENNAASCFDEGIISRSEGKPHPLCTKPCTDDDRNTILYLRDLNV